MASSMSHLIYSPLSSHTCYNFPSSNSLSFPLNHRFNSTSNHHHLLNLRFSSTSGAGGAGLTGGGGGGGDWSHGGDSSDGGNSENSSFWENLGLIGVFLKGWKSRVTADPQFPFKVLMEQLVGVTSCVLGDMASRPNFGLNELDFVFSTLIVGSILNFSLMYLLAPTLSPSGLPSIFSACPTSHMFEPGSFGLISRCGTLVYKGILFAAVGFTAGLVGTAMSNGLIKVRKSMDPSFEPPNKPPPTLLNAVTWALHMGLSSNLRYQTLNGVECVLEKAMSPAVFKASDAVLRCLNNVLGGVSFVVLARLTGSQSVKPELEAVHAVVGGGFDDGSVSNVEVEEKKLVNQST